MQTRLRSSDDDLPALVPASEIAGKDDGPERVQIEFVRPFLAPTGFPQPTQRIQTSSFCLKFAGAADRMFWTLWTLLALRSCGESNNYYLGKDLI
jgi:hypothetical protein